MTKQEALIRKVLTTHRPTPGQFAIPNNVHPDGTIVANQWWDCRDSFQECFADKTEVILFSHKSGHFDRVNSFISIVEELLNVSVSEVGLTQRKTISYVIPSDFWVF